jgi:hypothetical protein
MQITTTAPAGELVADRARRTITGMVVPWGSYARVSTGQNVAFARGSLTLSDRAKLVLDHDPAQPVAVYVSSTDTPAGLEATFRVPAGDRGDAILAEASEGLRDGLSVAADVETSDDAADGMWVTAARGRHVALLSEPAFDAARVSAVTANRPAPESEPAMTVTEPAPIVADPPAPLPAVITAAGAAAAAAPPTPAVVRDPYPYALAHHLGGPSFVRDALASWEDPGSIEADRWRRAQRMAADPAVIQAGILHIDSARHNIEAATGTTITDPALTPPRWMPERFVPIRAPKAPLYTALAKYPTPDFTTLELPRTLSESSLSGLPADEVTPIAPGDIATGNDTVTIVEVEGSYQFSRKLLMGSNPAIDRIALDAMNRAWLADVENRAVNFFLLAANNNALAATYATGVLYEQALRAAFAQMAAATLYQATVVVPASKEYIALAGASDTTGRSLLPYLGAMNADGMAGDAYTRLSVLGVPLMPGPYMNANKTLILDQSIDSAVIFETPVMSFRFESTTAPAGATTENVKVLQLTKYSGVGFWTQYKGGVNVMTNTTPLALDDLVTAEDDAPANNTGSRARK